MTGKIGRSLSFKRKARFAPRLVPEAVSQGALKWAVSVVDVGGMEKPCYLAISPNQIVIVEQKTKVRIESMLETIKYYITANESFLSEILRSFLLEMLLEFCIYT